MKNITPHLKDDHRLRVYEDEKTKEIHIEGNKSGLEFLVQICNAVIGQPPGPNHWHLSEIFDNVDPQSRDLIICYRHDFEKSKT
jgi:hypothetical protein